MVSYYGFYITESSLARLTVTERERSIYFYVCMVMVPKSYKVPKMEIRYSDNFGVARSTAETAEKSSTENYPAM